MEKNIILTIAVIGLLVFAGVQAIELANIKAAITGTATASQGGETYEQMMARMHPDLVQQQQAQPQSQMVGGC